MSTINERKIAIQRFYARNSLQCNIILRFVLGLIVFGSINANLGFLAPASSFLVTFGLAVVMAFLPLLIMVFAAVLLIIIQLYTLAIPIMAVTAIVFLVAFIVYARFTPNKCWVLLLVPIAFQFNIPFAIPVAFGLLGVPVMVVPAILGSVIYHLLHYIHLTEAEYAATGLADIVGGLASFINSALTNQTMWVYAIALSIGLLVVYALRTRSIDHNWKVATIAGVIVSFVIALVAGAILKVELRIGWMIFDVIIAILVGLILEVLFHQMDYKNTEFTQFEDEENYYYVKVVPKKFADVSVMPAAKRSGTQRLATGAGIGIAAAEAKKAQAQKPAEGASTQPRARSTNPNAHKSASNGRSNRKPGGRGAASSGRGKVKTSSVAARPNDKLVSAMKVTTSSAENQAAADLGATMVIDSEQAQRLAARKSAVMAKNAQSASRSSRPNSYGKSPSISSKEADRILLSRSLNKDLGLDQSDHNDR